MGVGDDQWRIVKIPIGNAANSWRRPEKTEEGGECGMTKAREKPAAGVDKEGETGEIVMSESESSRAEVE